MQKKLLTTIGLLCASALSASEIDSNVIHNYSFVELGYSHLHDIGNGGLNANGGVGSVSYDCNNFLFSLSGDYFVGDDDLGINYEAEFWSATAAIGYAVRLAENRINIIPSVGLSYQEVHQEIDLPFFRFRQTDNFTTLLPGITASYAFNNYVSLNAGYLYGYNFDTERGAHGFSVGSQVALADRIGLNVRANFVEDGGFSGISATLGYHF